MSEEGLNAYALIGPLLPLLTNVDIDEMVDALSSTGIKWVMLDRFRPRPGMFDDIARRANGTEVAERLEKAHRAEDYRSLEATVRRRFSEKGIRCVNAF